MPERGEMFMPPSPDEGRKKQEAGVPKMTPLEKSVLSGEAQAVRQLQEEKVKETTKARDFLNALISGSDGTLKEWERAILQDDIKRRDFLEQQVRFEIDLHKKIIAELKISDHDLEQNIAFVLTSLDEKKSWRR